MSLIATSWAFQQRGLLPISKLVLLHLAERHNPDRGCFPSQKTLAFDVEISRATLNRHLKILEKQKLIRRQKRPHRADGRRMSTEYYFSFEPAF